MKNVLVVDDSMMVRDLVGIAVKMLGHRVMHAEDGLQALEMIPLYSIDVVITDLNMPKIDGLEMIRQLKNNPLNRHIKIIAISSVEDNTILNRCRELQVDAYVTKPFSSQKIKEVLEKILENKKGEFQ